MRSRLSTSYRHARSRKSSANHLPSSAYPAAGIAATELIFADEAPAAPGAFALALFARYSSTSDFLISARRISRTLGVSSRRSKRSCSGETCANSFRLSTISPLSKESGCCDVLAPDVGGGGGVEDIRMGMQTIRVLSLAGIVANRSCSAVWILASSSARRRFRRRSSRLMGLGATGVDVVEEDSVGLGAVRVSVRDLLGTFCESFGRFAGLGGGDEREGALAAGRLPGSDGGSFTPSTSTSSPSTSMITGVSFALGGAGEEVEALDGLRKEYSESFPFWLLSRRTL